MDFIVNLILLWITKLLTPAEPYSQQDDMENAAAFFFGTAFTLENQCRDENISEKEVTETFNEDYEHTEW